MHLCYKFFTYLFYPLAPLYLLLRRLKKKEDTISTHEKLSKIKLPRGEGFLMWFHVASVGEAMSILPLIDSFEKNKKIDKILITSITLSSGNILKKKTASNKKIVHQFLPLDINTLSNNFLNHWRPNLSIFIDSEIWPNLILNLKKRKIPTMLINARISEKSFKKWRLVKNFAKNIFETFDVCIVSDNKSENFLKVLGSKNIKNYGNLKFTNIKTDFKNKLDSEFLEKIKNRSIWCAASTHPSEEIICGLSHLKIKKSFDNILTIIIPRHIDRVKKINEELSKLNLKIILSSEIEKVDESTDILLVNSYGEALKFYNISKCVFLGKSLVNSLINDSGQNPIEPARLGCKVFHGPNISNFVDTYQYLENLGITQLVKNDDELSLSLVEEFGKNREKNYQVAGKIETYGQNILNNVIVELKKYI